MSFVKWNKIEHRLFSFIFINWRVQPLTSLETVIELTSHTTTKGGLQVTAIKEVYELVVTELEKGSRAVLPEGIVGAIEDSGAQG